MGNDQGAVALCKVQCIGFVVISIAFGLQWVYVHVRVLGWP